MGDAPRRARGQRRTARHAAFGACGKILRRARRRPYISAALGHLFDLIRESNAALDRGALPAAPAAALLADWQRLDGVLALQRESAAVPAEVTALVEQRQRARAEKQWAESDRLRDAIAALGWVVKDTKDGPKLTPAP